MDAQRLLEELAEAITSAKRGLDNPKTYRDRVRVTLEARYADYGDTWLIHEAKKYGIETGMPEQATQPVRQLPVECGLCGMHISPAALLNPQTQKNEHGFPVSVGCAFRKTVEACSLARSIVTQIKADEVAA